LWDVVENKRNPGGAGAEAWGKEGLANMYRKQMEWNELWRLVAKAAKVDG